MVVRRKKKVKKMRGHRTYGYGSHKKHRGGGSRGGRGKAGMHKHKWIYTVKYEPDHFGKRGFKRPREVVKKPKTINLDELDRLVEKLLEEKKLKQEKGKIKVDLKELGYDKLLGRGRITHKLVIKVDSFSELAKKKVEAAGGEILTSEENEG
ncbi:MAG: uL15 family ribosomal protein [Candidatus Aenigmarchaeota archaeon]|nr:uL15 family ribosomal protein [Candidatus Aenigmarchaeota archaeon]